MVRVHPIGGLLNRSFGLEGETDPIGLWKVVVPPRTAKPTQFATMIGAVIDHVERNLPERRGERLAIHAPVLDDRIVGQPLGDVDPATVQAKQFFVRRLNRRKALNRETVASAQPHLLRRKQMRKNGPIGRIHGPTVQAFQPLPIGPEVKSKAFFDIAAVHREGNPTRRS